MKPAAAALNRVNAGGYPVNASAKPVFAAVQPDKAPLNPVKAGMYPVHASGKRAGIALKLDKPAGQPVWPVLNPDSDVGFTEANEGNEEARA